MNDASSTAPVKAAIAGLSAARFMGLADAHDFVRAAPWVAATGA